MNLSGSHSKIVISMVNSINRWCFDKEIPIYKHINNLCLTNYYYLRLGSKQLERRFRLIEHWMCFGVSHARYNSNFQIFVKSFSCLKIKFSYRDTCSRIYYINHDSCVDCEKRFVWSVAWSWNFVHATHAVICRLQSIWWIWENMTDTCLILFVLLCLTV